MKKTMVCILTLTVLCAALLAGCGETAGDGNHTTGTANGGNNGTAVNPTDNVPETMLPDVNDGIVDDTDGIIDDLDTEEEDNGPTGGGTVSGNTTADGASVNGNNVTGTASNVRPNGMTIGTRAKSYR